MVRRLADRPPEPGPRPATETARLAHDRLEVVPLHPADRAPLEQLSGVRVYVIEAAPFDEILIRRRTYIRELNAAPWWVDR